MGSEIGFKPSIPSTPSTSPELVPVYVDGKNGWKSPTGIIRGERVILIDPDGNSRLIERKRISLKPVETQQEEFVL